MCTTSRHIEGSLQLERSDVVVAYGHVVSCPYSDTLCVLLRPFHPKILELHNLLFYMQNMDVCFENVPNYILIID